MSVENQNSEPVHRADPSKAGLIVLGMHRSGTSALAGALGLCGAWLGESRELTDANVENPKGFWERRDLRAICDSLLHAAGADWWKVAAFEEDAIPYSTVAAQGRAFGRIVAELETHGTWVIKEPRLCLLFRILRPFLLEPVCIHVCRNPLDVAQSLRARNGFGIAEGLALWEAYNLKALQASAGLPRLIVPYEKLVSQPEEALSILLRELSSIGVTELTMPTTRELRKFITPSLRHQEAAPSEAIEFLLPSQQELWSGLQSGEALHSKFPGNLSIVARQYLRDLESRKGSIDQLMAKAKTSDAEAKKSASALRDHQARVGELEAEVEAKKAQTGALEASLTDRDSELRRERARADGYRVKLEASDTSLRNLKEAADYRSKELKKLAAQAKAAELRIGELEAQLSAVYSSNSWKLTGPLRAASILAKRAFRYLRAAFRLLSWIATGRFRKAADALLPRYRRSVPSRIRMLVPEIVRQAVKNRLGGEHASRPLSRQNQGKEGREDANKEAEPQGRSDSAWRSTVRRSRFGQELGRIVDRDSSARFADALRKSEDQLTQMVLRVHSLTDRPLVSVIMPTHNRAAIIGSTIATVLEQEYTNWELLICDDDSTDDTERVIAKFYDSRIRYLKLPKRGAAAARNAGLQNARGEIIAYLDSDNFWHPGFLSAIVLGLLENSGRSSIYADFIDFHIDKYGRRGRTSFRQSPFDHERLLDKPYIDLNSFAHRRELYECFGGFNEQLKRRQDYDLILKYTWLRDPIHVPCLTTLYQRNDSLTQITQVQREDRSCIAIIERSLESYFRKGLPVARRRPVEKVTILSWDVCRNHFSKPFALAEALSTEYDVQLISFRFFDEEIFPPLKGVVPPFETLYLPGSEFPDFFESMRRALAAIRGDIIYVVKPRLPSLGLALLANYQRGVPIALEINDLETVAASPKRSSSHTEAGFDALNLDAQELLNPYGDLWSQLMHPLAREVPVLATHNSAIDREFGHRCVYMRNVKDEKVYDPSSYDRDAVRAELGFKPEDRVVLFGGLIRKHKGIYQLVELVERLGNPRYKLLFVGSRPTPDQNKLIDRFGDRARVLPPQDRNAMARINYAADLVILWLDPSVPASHYQMPYKASDAFAMGPAVIANDISDLGPLARQGYLHVVPFGNWDAMTKKVSEIFDDPDRAAARRDASRRLFLRQFSYAAARNNFQLIAFRALSGSAATLPVADRFARRFNEFHRRVTRTDDDFIPAGRVANRLSIALEPEVHGYGESEEDSSIVIIDVRDLGRLFHDDSSGVAVVMPSIDMKRGLETARILVKRAGMSVTVFVVKDTPEQGFVRTLNDAAQRLKVAYLVYLAEDAFPGVDWLRIAYEALERTGKGLLAFNDGKWRGRIASFGMVRMQWIKKVYSGAILYPGYRAHKGDNELTLIARIMNDFIYEPTATLIELDPSKAFEGGEGPDGTKQRTDRNLFNERLHATFDSRFQWRDVAPYKDEYLNLRKLRAAQLETYEPEESAIQHVDIRSIRSLHWCDPEGIAVIMPCINPKTARATARLLVQQAGIAARFYIVEDALRLGFINALNDTASRLQVKYVVYLAEDAFPGENWLRTAHARMEETGKGLLAFNCGKWHGRVAAFGMVRKDWVRQVYGAGAIFHPAYKAHKADNELTVIARVTQQFIYEPDSVLIENDSKKIFKESAPEDKATFHRRFRAGFDGLVALEQLKAFAEPYFVPLEQESESERETIGPDDSDARTRRSADEGAGLRPHESLRSLHDHSIGDRKLAANLTGASSTGMMSLRAQVLEHEKKERNDPALSSILDTLRTVAEQSLQRSPYSVTDKTTSPPSGDLHDYWHPAPYWWPDPRTTDGLPYVRRDGKRVPGTRMYEADSDQYDRTRLQRVFDDSLTFGLAWHFFEETRYAEAGARILERFFVDPATRMTPHLKYAQVRMGHDEDQGAATGLIEAKDMYFYLDAVRLFQSAQMLSDSVLESFRSWLGSYLEWLLFSKQGKAECAAVNNHGTCYDLQVGAIASFLDERDVVHQTLTRAETRISEHIAPDGHQPEEMKRKATAHYSCFNLQSWINLAELSSRWGVDLWAHETPTGAGLKQAARWLLSHMGKPWPYEQIDAFDSERFLPIRFAASEQLDGLDLTDTAAPCIHAVKPIFFPHDGIRPFWNLASYAVAATSSTEMAARKSGKWLSGT